MTFPSYIKKTLLFVCSSLMLSVVASSVSAIEKAEQLCTLNITLDNIRNTKGNLYIFIYKYENQYPYNPELHFEVIKKDVTNGKLTHTVNNLSKGEYAITLLDDENANQDLDKLLGIPCEGFGFSNNVRPFLSLPKYAELTFDIDDSKTINLTLQYFL